MLSINEKVDFDDPIEFLKFKGYDKVFDLEAIKTSPEIYSEDKTLCLKKTTSPDTFEDVFGIFKVIGDEEKIILRILKEKNK